MNHVIEVSNVDELIIKEKNERVMALCQQLENIKEQQQILNQMLDDQGEQIDKIEEDTEDTFIHVTVASDKIEESLQLLYYENDRFTKIKTVGGVIIGSALGAGCLAIGIVPGLIAIGLGGTIGGVSGYCSKYLKRLF